jgi:membrane associated rhomboid family serine protease
MSIVELQVSLGRRLRVGQKILVGMFLVFAVLAVGIAGAIHNRETGIFAIVCLLAALLSFFEMRQVTDERAINARTLFYFHLWHGRRSKRMAAVWFGMCVLTGVMQFLAQRQMGGLENLVVGYGAYYPAMSGGEWWRVLSGPLFHSGVAHFVGNMVGIALLGPVASMVLTARVAGLAMLLGAPLGLLAAYASNAPQYDSFLGASGGLFALFGLVVGAGVFRPALLPSGLTIYWGLLALIFGVSAELVGAKVSSIAHLAGFSSGLILSLVAVKFVSHSNSETTSSLYASRRQ